MIEYNLHFHRLLKKLFAEMSEPDIRMIFDSGKKKQLKTGDYLIHQGDKENLLYIVLTGRLRAIAEKGKETQILGDIGEGDPVGEFALFTNEPRMASVIAIRESFVLEFNQQDYTQLVSKNPLFANILTKFIINRLRRNIFQQNKTSAPKNIAIINLQPENDLSPWTDEMESFFTEQRIPIQIFDYESQSKTSYEKVFGSLEQHDGLNIMVCDHEHPEWSHQCLVYSDLVVVATDFYANPNLYKIERELDLYAKSILNKRIFLLLLHPENAPMPKNTQNWLENRNVDLHIHIRQHHDKDIRRFCRIISNQSVGLVLSGGGAKGNAHLGAVKALLEEGIEIDFLGGTSAGAIYGITMSYSDFDFEKIDQIAGMGANRRLTAGDFTLPILSLKKGSKVKKFLLDVFKDIYLEDLWVNSYCVSTNYSNAKARIHKHGILWKQIQASIAIPGVFPPVVIDQQLHVDGGVVDNLPIEPMYQFPVGKIIAISLTTLTSHKVNYQESPSAWQLFWSKFSGKKKFKIPGLSSIIINSLMLNSRQKQEVTKSKVSLYFELNLKGVGFMDDRKWKGIREMGYQQTQAYLHQLDEKDKFWLNKLSDQ
ncbi:patatin-like phospholipase family protein [Fontibacter flavus]|uniref:Patatin-like phospholipase family protein n=1 Tax=Fontibacter flavus TaxID=654838 RepID=A0ABV6FUR5_9BACT